MTIPVIRLKPKEDKRITSGHQWVFSNEIAQIEGKPETGDVVEVRSKRDEQLGFGFYNQKTLIAIRIFSRNYVEPDRNFFIDRIQSALSLRQKIFGTPFYRLTYGESDFLPGLIIDRFDNLFTVQMLSAAIEKRKEIIYDSLNDLFSPTAIYERNDTSARELEGLAQTKSIVCGQEQTIDYDEEGVIFRINPFRGQKTGFYFDQRMNRIFSRRFGDRSRVLDLFSNEGGFGLNLSRSGATKVIAVDSSEAATRSVSLNANLNGLTNIVAETADVQSYLERAEDSGEKYDVIICDPPSFARNRRSVGSAKAGYRRLHESLFKIIDANGILLTACCSHHIYRETFEKVVWEAALRSGRSLQLLHRAGASPDHPVLPAMPETEYLKFSAYRVL